MSEQAAVTAPAPQVKRPVVILNPERRGLAEERRRDWIVDVEEGTTVEQVLDPAYWAHVCGEMTVFDRIDARLETGEWLLELIVTDVGRNYARVFLAKKHELRGAGTEEAPANTITHKVEFKGPHRKHVVIRLSDGAAIQEGISSKDEAVVWMNNHIRVSQMT